MPYNPGIEYRGDVYLARGLAGFGRGIGYGLEKRGEMKRYAEEQAKNEAREFRALQEYADATGIAPKDRTTVMDLASLKGFVRAAEFKRGQAEQQQAHDLEQQKTSGLLKYYQAQENNMLADNQRSQSENEALAKFAMAYTGAPTPLNTSGRMLHAMREAPNATGSQKFGELVRALDMANPQTAPAAARPELMKLDLDGRSVPVAYSATTGKWEFVPEAPGPDKVSYSDRVSALRARLEAAQKISEPKARDMALLNVMREIEALTGGNQGAKPDRSTNAPGFGIEDYGIWKKSRN